MQQTGEVSEPHFPAGGTWWHEPAQWHRGGEELAVHTDPATDFWRTTHYGFVRDNGHFLGQEVLGDFQAEVRVKGAYRDRYDQAGLMVRVDAEHWMKCGIEFVDGEVLLSSVVTRGVSDWSVATPAFSPVWLGIRVTREGDSLRVDFKLDNEPWQQHRMAFFPPGGTVLVGPMAASPDGHGFEARWRGLVVRPLPVA